VTGSDFKAATPTAVSVAVGTPHLAIVLWSWRLRYDIDCAQDRLHVW